MLVAVTGRLLAVGIVLTLSACAANGQTTTATPGATRAGHPAARTSATATSVAGLPTCGERPVLGILGAAVATATNPDGSAKAPAGSFASATTTTLIVVVSVRGMAAGTKLSFIRYLDGKFVDSKSAVIDKPTPYFYFQFSAKPGQHIATGSYQVRLYVNETRACSIQYTVF